MQPLALICPNIVRVQHFKFLSVLSLLPFLSPNYYRLSLYLQLSSPLPPDIQLGAEKLSRLPSGL